MAHVVDERVAELHLKGCDTLVAAVDDLGDVLGQGVVLSTKGASFLAWLVRFDHSAMEGLGALVGDLRTAERAVVTR